MSWHTDSDVPARDSWQRDYVVRSVMRPSSGRSTIGILVAPRCPISLSLDSTATVTEVPVGGTHSRALAEADRTEQILTDALGEQRGNAPP